MGPRKDRGEITCGIPTVKYNDSIKILGIFFNANIEASLLEQNWDQKMEKMNKIIKQWQKRNLSIIGKIVVAKTFVLSIWSYTLQALSLPEEILASIDTMMFRFIWQRKHANRRAFEKVKRAVLCLPVEEGGLGMISIKDQQKVMLIKWLNRNKRQYGIADIFFKKYGSIEQFIECNPKIESINRKSIPSVFWCTVAREWQGLKKKCFKVSDYNILDQTIFHNELIKYKNNTIFIPRW